MALSVRLRKAIKRSLLSGLLSICVLLLSGCDHCDEGDLKHCLHMHQGTSCSELNEQMACYQYCCGNEIESGGGKHEVNDLTKNLAALLRDRHERDQCSPQDPCAED